MCGNMVDIKSVTAENRRGKKKEEDRRNHGDKIECPHLLCRATIIIHKKLSNCKQTTFAHILVSI